MNPTLDFAAAALQSLTALAMVLVLMAVIYIWWRRRIGSSTYGVRAGSIKVVASACLGLRKSICVVDVMGTLLVVAINRDDIRLLDRLEPSALGPVASPPPAPKGFAAQLRQILGTDEGRADG